MSSPPLQILWGAHNVWGGGELVHYWDHAASPSTVDHILCSGSTCVLCRREWSGFPPVETSPCSPLALIMLTDCTATLCSFAMQHVVPSERLVVPETPHRPPACLAIKQIATLPHNTILFSQSKWKYCSIRTCALQYNIVHLVQFAQWLGTWHWNQGETKRVKTIIPGFLHRGGRSGLALPVAILSIFLFVWGHNQICQFVWHHNQREGSQSCLAVRFTISNWDLGRSSLFCVLGHKEHFWFSPKS